MVATRKLSSDLICPGACTPGNISEIKNLIAIICIKLAEWIITFTSRLDLRGGKKHEQFTVEGQGSHQAGLK